MRNARTSIIICSTISMWVMFLATALNSAVSQTATSIASLSGSFSVPTAAPAYRGHLPLQSSSSTDWIEANPVATMGIGAGSILGCLLCFFCIKKCRRRILNKYRRRRIFPQPPPTRTTSRTSSTSSTAASSSSSPATQSRPLSTTVNNVVVPVLDLEKLKPVLELSRTLTAVKEEPTKVTTTQPENNSLPNSIASRNSIASMKSPQHSPEEARGERDILVEATILQQKTRRAVLVPTPPTPAYATIATQSSAEHPLTGQLISGTIKL
jgi:hypothetical protein